MARIEKTTFVHAIVDEVVEYLKSDEYLRQVASAGDLVIAASIESSESTDDGLERVVRWEAPTRLPWFLRNFKKKAPKTIAWQERERWSTLQRTYNVFAEAPDHWHDQYDGKGSTTIEPDERGVKITDSLDFRIGFPGLGPMIEKSLVGEIEELFALRHKVIYERFESGR